MRVTGTLELDGQSIKFEQGGDSTTLTAGAAASDITLTLPATTDTLVGLATTDTLTNKTLTSPKLNENVAVTTTATKLNYITSATGTTGTASTNIVFSTSPTLVTPVLGTPTSVTLTNATGLPVSTGISGLGSNVATFLATPSSANLAAALTDETGSGAAVFGTSPSITTPNITSYVNLLAEGAIRFNDNTGGEYAAIKAPATISASYTLTLPDTDGTPNQVLLTDGSGVLSWTDMLLTNPMDSAGDLIYGGAAGAATKLDAGTANYMLQANGAAAPTWNLIANANVDASAAIAVSKLAALTASKALASDASGFVSATSVTSTELGYLSGVTAPTGTGALVLATSPTLVTPALGTPSAAVLTNATGLPVSTGISGLAAGVATFLATPSSANLISAVTDETGSGALVFGTSPVLSTLPNLQGSLHVGTTGAATGITGTDFRYIGNKSANILFTDSTTAGTMSLYSGLYYGAGDTLTRYTIEGSTGGVFDVIARASLGSAVFQWSTGTSDTALVGDTATTQVVGSVTGNGLWTLGVTSGTQTHVVNGQLSVTGGQIAFPATQNASSNVNTLDDYEEGTWSPVLASTGGGSVTYTHQKGSYVKVGKAVHYKIHIVIATDSLTAGNLSITLPFTSENVADQYSAVECSYWDTLTTAVIDIGGYNPFNNSTLILHKTTAATANFTTRLLAADVEANSTLILSGTFMVAT